MKPYIQNYINESIDAKKNIFNNESLLSKIEDAAYKIIETYNQNKKVLLAGNGGSAADAQHLAAELVSKFFIERPALNAIALNTNTSVLTSVGNDFSHEYIFARQIEAFATEGDVFIAISTSGNSKNIIKAIQEAKKKGVFVIGLTGEKESEMSKICDIIIKVPSQKTPIVQESHIMIGHIICAIIEEKLFG